MSMFLTLTVSILGAALAGVLLYALNLWSSYEIGIQIYGKMLTHQELVNYFNKTWDKYDHLIGTDLLTSRQDLSLGYIGTRIVKQPHSRYHIRNVGQIPKKSPYTALIDRKIEELKAMEDAPI